MEQTLGKRIIENRKRLGMTQDKLAERLGVTAQAVSKWENDQSCPDITMLPKLAEIFGVSTDALLGIEAAEKVVHEAEVVHESDGTEGFSVENKDNRWEMKWDSGRRGGISFAVWVLVTGGLLLAATMLDWDTGLWDIAWPSAMLVFSLFGLLGRFSFFSLGCALFGGYFLLENLNVPLLSGITLERKLLLPLIILLLGASLLVDALKKSRKPHFTITRNGEKVCTLSNNRFHSECVMEGESFTCSNSFGEEHHRITLDRLSSGDISASFGQLTVDLSGCGEIANGCRIDANNSFGELDILVPRCCRVELATSSAFGNIEVSGSPDPDASTVIYMDCSASFGEIDVKYI